MKKYSISQAAKMLSLSKDTLRYYDKLGLVQPTRGENKYRYYSDMDILLLKYVEVMKFSGLSLSKISMIMLDIMEHTEDNRMNTLKILVNKKDDLERKIRLYQELVNLMVHSINELGSMSCPADMEQVDNMVNMIYVSMEKGGYADE